MSLQDIRESRNMPFLKRGMRFTMDGRAGRVTSSYSGGLRVKFDGMNFVRVVHPYWRMVYFNKDGSVAKDYTLEGNHE
jgi:hypothetical protein